jgi:predicted RecA/RadA family phage recombinase
MAKNTEYEFAFKLHVPVAEGKKSGDPVLVGVMPGVCLTDRDSNGEATVQFVGAFRLKVIGKEGSENKEIKFGEKVFIDSEGKLTKKESGNTLFGYVLKAVASGKEESVPVKIATP